MENWLQTRNTLETIHRLSHLPPLNHQSHLLLATLNDPKLESGALVDLLEQSPALAARILGIARSAFFAGTSPPRDLNDAVVRFLGLNLVRDLAIAFTLCAPFYSDLCLAFDSARYWRHALLTASLADQLAKVKEIPGGNWAYLAGLLHNLGLLVLVNVAPRPMHEILTAVEKTEQVDLSEAELLGLGIDHCQAGRRLADSWKLPREIADVMASHRDRRYRGSHWELVTLTALAERFCSGIETDFSSPPPVDDGLLGKLNIAHETWEQVVANWLPKAESIAEQSSQFRQR